jgi:hypothetical protein
VARTLRIPWYEAFLKCASPHTDAPDRFLIWSAFSVIGAAMKNRVHMLDGLYTLYPNQYIILVSPPGIGKGTAINFAWNIVRDSQPNYICNMIPDRVTAPRILERIADGWNSAPAVVGQQVTLGAKDHTCTIYSTELRVLVSASDWMLEFLCESWDRNSYDYDTKNKGSSFITDMCTSLVGGTVPDYLRGIDRDSDISIKGGFTSRCLFVYEEKPSKDLSYPPPLSTHPASVQLLRDLSGDLRHIATLAGEYALSIEARIKFDAFFRGIRTNTINDSEAIATFKGRIRAHVHKLAMVIAASRHDHLTIEGLDMDNAIGYVAEVLRGIEKIFRGAGESDLSMSTSRVQAFMEKVGACSKREMLKHLHRHMTIDTLDRVLFLLETIGWCHVTTTGKTTMWVQTSPQNAGRKNP